MNSKVEESKKLFSSDFQLQPVLRMILSFIPTYELVLTMSLVSKNFLNVIRDSDVVLVDEIITPLDKTVLVQHLHHLLLNHNVRKLTILKSKGSTKYSDFFSKNQYPHIRVLRFADKEDEIPLGVLCDLIKNCPNLDTIMIGGNVSDLTIDNFQRLPENHENLSSFSYFGNNIMFMNTFVGELKKKCPKLDTYFLNPGAEEDLASLVVSPDITVKSTEWNQSLNDHLFLTKDFFEELNSSDDSGGGIGGSVGKPLFVCVHGFIMFLVFYKTYSRDKSNKDIEGSVYENEKDERKYYFLLQNFGLEQFSNTLITADLHIDIKGYVDRNITVAEENQLFPFDGLGGSNYTLVEAFPAPFIENSKERYLSINFKMKYNIFRDQQRLDQIKYRRRITPTFIEKYEGKEDTVQFKFPFVKNNKLGFISKNVLAFGGENVEFNMMFHPRGKGEQKLFFIYALWEDKDYVPEMSFDVCKPLQAGFTEDREVHHVSHVSRTFYTCSKGWGLVFCPDFAVVEEENGEMQGVMDIVIRMGKVHTRSEYDDIVEKINSDLEKIKEEEVVYEVNVEGHKNVRLGFMSEEFVYVCGIPFCVDFYIRGYSGIVDKVCVGLTAHVPLKEGLAGLLTVSVEGGVERTRELKEGNEDILFHNLKKFEPEKKKWKICIRGKIL